MTDNDWKVFNPAGSRRVVVTKELPGIRWLEVLAQADARVEYGTETRILRPHEIAAAIGDRCDGAIGQRAPNRLRDGLNARNHRSLGLLT